MKSFSSYLTESSIEDRKKRPEWVLYKEIKQLCLEHGFVLRYAYTKENGTYKVIIVDKNDKFVNVEITNNDDNIKIRHECSIKNFVVFTTVMEHLDKLLKSLQKMRKDFSNLPLDE